ncbi:MAG TPA: YaaR family protein [Spirochaetia bacterium]|nr:YaaR family protein [Spirochaetia bacterium]
MARIDSLGEASSWLVPDKKKAGKKEKTQRRTFSQLVEAAARGEGAAQEELSGSGERHGIEELLDGVFASGDALKKSPTLDAIKEYRQKVKDFLKYVVENSVRVEETTSGTNILKRKRFTLIRVIDERLDALATQVLSGQKDQLSILAQIDQINGMLVDLVS